MSNGGVWSTRVHRRTLAEEEAMWGQCWKYSCSKGWGWIMAFHNCAGGGPAVEISQIVSSWLFCWKCLPNLCKPRPMNASLVRFHSLWTSVQHRTWRAYLNAGAAPLPPSSDISQGCVASCHRLTVRFIATGRFSMEMQARDAAECVPGAPEKENKSSLTLCKDGVIVTSPTVLWIEIGFLRFWFMCGWYQRWAVIGAECSTCRKNTCPPAGKTTILQLLPQLIGQFYLKIDQ